MKTIRKKIHNIYFNYYELLYPLIAIGYVIVIILSTDLNQYEGDDIKFFIDFFKLIALFTISQYIALTFRRYLLNFYKNSNILYLRGVINVVEMTFIIYLLLILVDSNGMLQVFTIYINNYLQCTLIIGLLHFIGYGIKTNFYNKNINILYIVGDINSQIIIFYTTILLLFSDEIITQVICAYTLLFFIIYKCIIYEHLHIQDERKISFKISNINIRNRNILSEKEMVISNTNIVELKLEEFFPPESQNRYVDIKGYECYRYGTLINKDNNDTSILVAISNTKTDIKTLDLSIKYSYVLDGKEVVNKMYASIDFFKYSQIIYPRNILIYKGFRCIGATNIRREDNISLTAGEISNIAVDLFTWGEDDEVHKIKSPTSNQMNFMYQDGAYGEGKTTFALLKLINNGYTPIVISPWDENTCNNIIYAILLKLNKTNNNISFNKLAKKTCIIFITIYTLLFKEVIEFFNETPIVFNFNIIICFIMIGLFLYHIIYKLQIVNLLVIKDQLSIYYKDALVEDLITVMDTSDSKYVFLIEDIDRMEIHEVKSLFKDISYINRCFNNSANNNRLLGVVSFDMINLEERFDLKMNNNYGKDKIENYKDLHDKIFYEEFSEEYNAEEILECYIEATISDLKYFDHDYFIEDTEKEKMTTFREAKNILNKNVW